MATPTKGSRTRTELNLKDKVSVIKEQEKTRESIRKLATKFSISRTQVENILKRKRDYLEAFEDNCEESRKRPKVVSSVTERLNEVMWTWFQRVQSKNVPVSGPMCQEQAKIYAKELGLDSFVASNGWLGNFRKRHNIKFHVICGESDKVSEGTVTDWTSKLPHT